MIFGVIFLTLDWFSGGELFSSSFSLFLINLFFICSYQLPFYIIPFYPSTLVFFYILLGTVQGASCSKVLNCERRGVFSFSFNVWYLVLQ